MSRPLFWIGTMAALAALAGVNALMAQDPLDTTPIMTASAGQQAALQQGDIEIGSRNFAVAQTRSRPLFSPARRPYVEPPAPPPPKKKPAPAAKAAPPSKPKAPPPQLRLYGVQMTPNGRKALIAEGNSNVAEWVEEGARIGKWAIFAITPDGIEIGLGEQRRQVDLHPAFE